MGQSELQPLDQRSVLVSSTLGPDEMLHCRVPSAAFYLAARPIETGDETNTGSPPTVGMVDVSDLAASAQLFPSTAAITTEPERLCRFEVNDQHELCGLLDRKVVRPRALKDAINRGLQQTRPAMQTLS